MQKRYTIGKRLKQFRIYLGLDQSKLAKLLDFPQNQVSKYENDHVAPSSKFYSSLCQFPELNMRWVLTGEGEMLNNNSTNTSDVVFIPYWEGCPTCIEKTRKSTISDGIYISRDVITKEWGCIPESLKIISMPGEDMDGGIYPIRNDDILVIDTIKKNISDSGVYLVTTHNCQTVFVRRLVELIDGSVSFSVDNEKYAPGNNVRYSREELTNIDFTVIGRVVKNVTYTL